MYCGVAEVIEKSIMLYFNECPITFAPHMYEIFHFYILSSFI